MTALAVVLLCGAVAPNAAWSARWIDRLPADDPDTVFPQQAGTYPPRPVAAPTSLDVQRVAGAPDAAPAGVYGATTSLLWSAVGVVQSVSAVTREALWETAYMLGVNTTPVPRTTQVDPVTDLAPARDNAQPRIDAEARDAQPRDTLTRDGIGPGPEKPAVKAPGALRVNPPMVRLAQFVAPTQTRATDAVVGQGDAAATAELAPPATPPVPPSAAAPVTPQAVTPQAVAAPSGTASSGTASSGTASSGATSSGAAPSGAAPSGAAAAGAAAAGTAQTQAPERLASIDPGLLANFVYDRGARRPDGSFFVPKSLQRLFELHTKQVVATQVPVTLSLAGRIVADPQNHGDVEASLLGRIESPESGLPVLGQTVHSGDILAYVVPAVGVVDRTQIRSQIAKLTTDIRVETENLEILKQFSFVPFRDGKIYQSEQRIAGLRREREALLPLLQTQEVLRASADGVISTSTAIAGRIVHPGEAVFTIVNPKKLWIEALAPDPTIAESAARVRQASAVTPEGQTLALTFVGSGLVLREQSAPVMFRIDNPPEGLQVGRPVTVAVRSENHSQSGLPVSRDALTIGADGVQEVWEQSEPEVFLPRAVRTVDIDGRSVLVIDGLKEGAHVVVSGVRLLAQLQ